MNLKDRGNKKWNSLMLVEHQRKLRELKLNENNQDKPELDQQQLADINFKIQKSLNENLTLKIIYYENKKIKNTTGKILKIQEYKKEVKIKTNSDQFLALAFEQIIEVTL
jgi:hypothetical protein